MKNSIFGSIIGSIFTLVALILFVGWGKPQNQQNSFPNPTRDDYVDLLLSVTTILLGAIGLGLAFGAIVIGIVAFKTLREIKDDVTKTANASAVNKINETITEKLEPSVKIKVTEVLPANLNKVIIDDGLGHEILSSMAKNGELDDILERVASRMQGGPEDDPENP
ncbi:MAG: hypothetical protein OXH47_02070 [Paracoccaceae bacterium]|nr:hypothetical protein [Paracoccaceae bacterium]